MLEKLGETFDFFFGCTALIELQIFQELYDAGLLEIAIGEYL